jgi:hypothetical protein
VPERIGVLIICDRLVPERIGVLIICDRLVPERIGVLIICDRWVPVKKKIINCKLVLAEEHKERCFVVFSRIGFPRKNPGVLCFLCCF